MAVEDDIVSLWAADDGYENILARSEAAQGIQTARNEAMQILKDNLLAEAATGKEGHQVAFFRCSCSNRWQSFKSGAPMLSEATMANPAEEYTVMVVSGNSNNSSISKISSSNSKSSDRQ